MHVLKDFMLQHGNCFTAGLNPGSNVIGQYNLSIPSVFAGFPYLRRVSGLIASEEKTKP